SLFPALELANALRRSDALVPIFWGLFAHVHTRGRAAESRRWATQAMDAAAAYGDPGLLILAHFAGADAHFFLGEPSKARENADQVLALYSEERHGHLLGILSQDPKTGALIIDAHSTWMLGYPEQAVKIAEARDAYARRRGHPFDLGLALTFGAQV